ncbi:N-acetyltransferase [Deltaproteobacteria bacterium]|nr:N-acetyltransferase [Deltaproteobacteria bacterium]
MTPTLLTERLILRPMDASDVSELVRLNADPLVLRFTGDGPLDEAAAAVVLRDRILPQYALGIGRLAVVHRDDLRFLGWCGLRRDAGGEDAGFTSYRGYRFHTDERGRGFATEAALAVLDDARRRLPDARILGRVDPANLASQRVLERCGLRRYGEQQDGDRFVWLYR